MKTLFFIIAIMAGTLLQALPAQASGGEYIPYAFISQKFDTQNSGFRLCTYHSNQTRKYVQIRERYFCKSLMFYSVRNGLYYDRAY